LASAAASLFRDHGFEQTTVDQIAAAVDVSPRTFFRYFATKEDVALEPARAAEERFLENLRNQPADLPPLAALRNSSQATWRSIEAEGLAQRHLDTMLLLASTPGLANADSGRSEAHRQALVGEVRSRLGAGQPSELMAELIVELFGAATRVAQRNWLAGGGGPAADLMAELDRCLDAIPALPLALH
jgi:AcrR family transcriptional regulator